MKKLIAIILTVCTLVLAVACTDVDDTPTDIHTQSTHPDAMEELPIDSSIDEDIKKLSITEKQEIDSLVAGSGEIVKYDMAVDSNGNFYMVLSTDKDLFKLVRKTGDGFEVLGEGAVSEYPRFKVDEYFEFGYNPNAIHLFFGEGEAPYVGASLDGNIVIYRYDETAKKLEMVANHKLYYGEEYHSAMKRAVFDDSGRAYFEISHIPETEYYTKKEGETNVFPDGETIVFPDTEKEVIEIAIFDTKTHTFISEVLENMKVYAVSFGYSSAEDTVYMGGEKIAVETETTSDYDSVIELYKLKLSGETITAEKVMTIAENLKNSEDFVPHLYYSFSGFKFDNEGRMYISYSAKNLYNIGGRSTIYLMTLKNGEVIKEIEQEPYFYDKTRYSGTVKVAEQWFYGNQYYFIISYNDIRDYMTFGKLNLVTGEVSYVCDLDMPEHGDDYFTAVSDGTGGFHCLTTLAEGGYMYFRIS
ncbi:MAG: hypothetical protein IJX55_09100 [Clostridia bacterium]|nr:hypothetical protein [Clostridia bacterium]